MPFYKCIARVNARSAGWSETYYLSSPDIVTAIPIFVSLMTLRKAILAAPADIVALTVSDDSLQGSTFSFFPALGPGWLSGQLSSDTPWQSFLCKIFSGSQWRRPLYLRGIPDLIFQETTSPTDDTLRLSWFSAVDTFLNALTLATWKIKGLTKEPGNPRIPISNITRDPVGFAQIVLAANPIPAWLPGQSIHVYRARVGNRPFGIARITTVGPGGLQIGTSRLLPPDYLFGDIHAVAQIVQYSYHDINNATRERITHRITGRPFGLQRGARRRVLA